MLMTFGKYKGHDVGEIPEDYLLWLIETVDLREPLLTSVRVALGFEEKVIPLSEDRIRQAYRRVAKEFHPDAGGSDVAMAAINRFYEILKERV